MLAILTRIIPFLIGSWQGIATFLLGLTPKQLMIVGCVVLLLGTHYYAYNSGINHVTQQIERKALEDAKKKQNIRNRATDDSTVIKLMRNGKF
jgi:hypothetical protein